MAIDDARRPSCKHVGDRLISSGVPRVADDHDDSDLFVARTGTHVRSTRPYPGDLLRTLTGESAFTTRRCFILEDVYGTNSAMHELLARCGARCSPTLATLVRARAALHSLIHSGLFQAASALRKTLNLKGRNFRFE